MKLEELTQKISDLETELAKTQWLHNKENIVDNGSYIPFYGDVTELNTERTIIDNVGIDTLKKLTSELMDLLDTSIAIYEKNGDYAYGEFDSGWCQLLDASSRKLCNTSDNKIALDCGKWLCHDNCWNNSAKAAIMAKKSTNIDCVGKIKLYAEPIFVDDEVVGVINLGYGNPPTDDRSLKELSEKFSIDFDILKQKALAYKPRPDFIIEIAKKRLKSIAHLIGEIISRKRAEQALFESENKFETIFNMAQSFICIADINTFTFKFINPTFEKVLGYSEQELLNKPFLDFIHPDDVKATLEVVEKQLQAGFAVQTFENRYLCKNGNYCWLNWNSYPVPEKGITYAIALDVTERKKKEEELKSKNKEYSVINKKLNQTNEKLFLAKQVAEENQYFLRKAQEIGVIGTWELDLVLNKLKWTEENYKIFGVPVRTELTYEIFLNCIHPDDREYVDKKWKKALINETYDIEHRLIVDNKIKWVREKAEIEFDENNIPVKALGVTQDITERKKGESIIQQNNNRLEILLTLYEMSHVEINDIYDFTLEKSLELCDSQIGFLGFLDNEETQVNIHAWSASAMKSCAVKDQNFNFNVETSGIWGEVIRQRKPLIINDYSAENPLKRGVPKGHVKITNFLSIPVFDNNKIVAVIALGNKETDYTDNDLQELNLLMKGMWNIVKQKKNERELVIAKEKAEEANRLKTEFLNNMSHEIRTPMNGIVGFSESLSKPGLTDEKRKYYTNIVQNCSYQLLRIIDDILEISILETRQDKIHETEFSLNDLLMELFSIFSLKLKERSIPLYLKKALHDTKSYIVSDKTKLHKIVSNLIENALKFTIEGFVEFGYMVENDLLKIYVKDTGIGVSPKNQEIIFDRFSQEDGELSRKHGGLGLGLSICKANAQLLGGDISVESVKGKGSIFYLIIPYKPVGVDIDDAKKIFTDIEKSDDIFTILIAEDEEVNYLYLEVLFEDEIDGNYSLIHAINGKEAVEICMSNNDIDLVLMDIKMPILNGLEATEKIKEKFPDMPVIAQTAYSTELDKQLALKHGCDDFVSKPINKEKLFGIVNKYLKIK